MNNFWNQSNLEEQLLQIEAQLANNEKYSVSAMLHFLCNAALFALHCKHCFELNFALNILHCTATVECNHSVQLKQILDFSLGCKAQCNRDHCWH